MSLKILLADDSMTAQNMGKKILVDAGFEVVPVSNGAAAFKKIAETKPDIVILDIYMPGYTGLEVCDKVKNAAETANLPVLLTVGKLEPYRPEDGAKVKAEGVIIKPFEASDLLAALGRIAEKYNLAGAPAEATAAKTEAQVAAPALAVVSESAPYEKTVKLSSSDVQDKLAKGEAANAVAASAASPMTMPTDARVATQKIEIPAFVSEAEASSKAAAAHAEAAAAPMFGIEDTGSIMASPSYSSVSSNEAPAYTMDEPVVPAPSFMPSAVEFTATSVPDEVAGANNAGEYLGSISSIPGAISDPSTETAEFEAVSEDLHAGLTLPPPNVTENGLETFQHEDLSMVPGYDPALEPTAAPKVVGDFAQLSELEPTQVADDSPLPQTVDPALATTPEDLMQFAVHSGTSNDEAETPTESSAAHGHFDPMAEMHAMSAETAATPELVEEFNKPVTADEDELYTEAASPTSGLLSAIHEYEAAAKSEELPEVEHIASAKPFETVSSVLHPDTSAMPSVSAQVESLLERMAAIDPTIPDSTPMNPELAKETSFDNGLASSVPASTEASDGSKTMSMAAGMETKHVANAVQRVFERYKEKMIADITDELRKGSE